DRSIERDRDDARRSRAVAGRMPEHAQRVLGGERMHEGRPRDDERRTYARKLHGSQRYLRLKRARRDVRHNLLIPNATAPRRQNVTSRHVTPAYRNTGTPIYRFAFNASA